MILVNFMYINKNILILQIKYLNNLDGHEYYIFTLLPPYALSQ